MKQLLVRHSPLVILAALCLVLMFWSENFRSADNMQSLARRTCVVGIIAGGQVLVILTGGIDLSVGSVAALSGVVAGLLMKDAGLPVPVAVLIGTAAGALCGLINGALVTKGRIPPFIVTLGMMMAARGAALLLSGAKPIFGLPEGLKPLGGTREWWIPVAVTLAIILAIAVVLTFTRYGRAVYAVGGNLQGARLSGIPVDRVRILAYMVCGMLAGFAGIVESARTVASPTAGEGYELDAIAACVIGGASLMGGEGGALGALAGALIMSVLQNFCNLEGINVHWQKVLIGGLIVLLVFYDSMRKRKAGMLKE